MEDTHDDWEQGLQWWTSGQAADCLGVSSMQVKNFAVGRHELPYVVLPGGDRRFDPDAVEAYRDGYRWWRLTQVAHVLGVSVRSVERLLNAGVLSSSTRAGRVHLWRPEDVVSYRDRVMAGEYDPSDLCEDDLPSLWDAAARTAEMGLAEVPATQSARVGRPPGPNKMAQPRADLVFPMPRASDAEQHVDVAGQAINE